MPIGSLFSVAYAVLEALSACSARQRVLLVVDDAGWVDEQTWGVLSFIRRRIYFDQIVLIMAVRDGVEGDRRLRDSSLPTLRIEPLPDEAATALLDHVAPSLDPRIRSRILLEAGGNPLGLLELSDEARRRGPAAMPETFMPLPDRLEQVLFYPVTSANFDTGSYLQFAEGYFLRRDNMMWFWDQYMTDPGQRAEITAAPLNATPQDLEGMPATLIINGEADVLRDEGEAYGDKLRAAGVPVTAIRYAGMIHDFVMLDHPAQDARRRGRHSPSRRLHFDCCPLS